MLVFITIDEIFIPDYAKSILIFYLPAVNRAIFAA